MRHYDKLALQLQHEGNHLKAMDTMEKSLALRLKVFGVDSPDAREACKVLGAMCNRLARCYLEQNRLSRVEELLQKALRLTAWDRIGHAACCCSW
jgi:tetratricopeptide (TPR) repeat protein